MTARDNVSEAELCRLIIEEVDQARDVYDLTLQLAPLLPIGSFEELVKAQEGRPMRFRDVEFDVESLAGYIPNVVFPVQDLRGLVERLGHLIRLVPDFLGVDTASEAGARRQLRSAGSIAPGIGMMSQQMVTASTLGPGMTPPPRQ